ncbi:MAG: Uma2 family endonuclease [Spirosomaceae bacterium]|nr:Uma2 family endonuclease [Spirosomataceae bacterium]
MTATQQKIPRASRKIPKYLIYEQWGGKIYYRKGYQDVLKGIKTPEEIMGSSGLQSVIVGYLIGILFTKSVRQKYFLLTNEAGLHLAKRENMAGDVAIYDKAVLRPEKVTTKYPDVPPKVVIEVDIEVELKKETELDYVFRKSARLMEFGTEKVIWAFSKIQKVFIFEPHKEPVIVSWDKDIDVFEGVSFNIAQFLAEEGIQISTTDEGRS